MAIQQFNVKLKQRINLTDDLAIFKFALNPGNFEFKSGQFANLQLTQDNKMLKRPYSMASSPSNKNEVEFICRSYPQGGFTPYLFKIKQGDSAIIRGPFGNFTLQDNDSDVIFIAAGTGIAPFMSILKWLNENNSKRNIFMIHVAKNPMELAYHTELTNISKNLSNFNYVASISRDYPKWKGKMGRAEDLVDELINFDINKKIYVCGPPPMVTNVLDVLFKKGFDKANIYTEQYY